MGTYSQDRRALSKAWRRFFYILLVACAIAYSLNLVFSESSPANVWGMGYGIAATVFLAGITLWALRRRAMKIVSKLHLGSARQWLYFHTYGGVIFILLVLMHSGFTIPSGALNFWLWIACLWTVFSGFIGLALQHWIPKILASGLSVEVLYERIPELVDEIRSKSQKLVATCGEAVQLLYQTEVASLMEKPQRKLIFYLDITGGIQTHLKGFHYLEGFLPSDERKKLRELERLFKTKLEIDAHYSLQYLLRWWLVCHVPPSLIMIGLVGLHLFSVLYY